MTPREITDVVIREAPVLRHDDTVSHAVSRLLEAGLPALPVVGPDGRFAGLFGEREFMTAVFPGYLRDMGRVSFVRRSIESVLEKRAAAAGEPVSKHLTTDHVDVTEEFSDVELAELFLHHRVLVVPVVSGKEIIGVVTRSDFFRAVAERFVDR